MRVADAGEAGFRDDGELRHKIGFGDLQVFLGVLQLQFRDFQRFPLDKRGLDELGLVEVDVRDLRFFQGNQMVLVRTQRFGTVEVVHLKVDDVAEIVLAVPDGVAGGKESLFLAGDPGFRLDHFVAGDQANGALVARHVQKVLGEFQGVFLGAGLFAPIIERPVVGHDLRDEGLHVVVKGFLGDPPVVPGDSDGRHVDVHAEASEQRNLKADRRGGAVKRVAPHVVLLVSPASREAGAQGVLDTGSELALDAHLVSFAFRFGVADVQLGVVGNVEGLVNGLAGLWIAAHREFLLIALHLDVRTGLLGAVPVHAGGEIRVEGAFGDPYAFPGVFGVVALDGEAQVLFQAHGDAVAEPDVNVGVDEAVVNFAGEKILVHVLSERFDARRRGFPEARSRRKLGLEVFLERILEEHVRPV